MDTEYLRTQLGGCLVECLVEVAQKRPLDPIEYIAHWLYKHIDNTRHAEQEANNAVCLQQEQEQHEKDMERQEKMKEERAKIKAEQLAKEQEEEAAAKAKEAADQESKDAAGAPNLPTVVEGEEPESARLAKAQGEEEEGGGEDEEGEQKETTGDEDAETGGEEGGDTTQAEDNTQPDTFDDTSTDQQPTDEQAGET